MKPFRALITGGSRGIGFAIAKNLAPHATELFLTARDERQLKEAAATIESDVQCQVHYQPVDHSHPEAAATVTAKWLSDYSSSLDVLVLNAGFYVEGSLEKISKENFTENMNVNFSVNLYLVQAFLPLLKKGVNPRIIIIGSTAAYEPYTGLPTYGVAKWALRGYAINLRKELMADGIGVTFIAPGGTLTSMWDGEDIPKGRLLDPDDVGRIVAATLTLSAQAVVEEVILRPMLGDLHD